MNVAIAVLAWLTINTTMPISWAQQTFNNLTLDQKIGQLFIATCIIDQASNIALGKQYPTDVTSIQHFINDYQIGGIIFLGIGNASEQIHVTQQFQKNSQIPLFIAQDFEWGLTMRLPNELRFPRAMTLGALENDTLIYDMAQEIARQCHILGVHINFAPVVDVNCNPKNPIINDRSFGENKELVVRKGILYMQGLHDGGIIACAKHFPGHGDTHLDSHEDLPKITHDTKRLETFELYPFKKLIEAGIPSIMIAHLEIPALEKTLHLPSSLSRKVVTDLLRSTYGFQGLIITDGLDMQGVLKHHKPGEIELKALLAGNDILLCPTNIPAAIAHIKQALKDGILTEKELDMHVLRILHAKEWAFKQHYKQHSPSNKSLTTPHTSALKEQLYSQAITVVPRTPGIPIMLNHKNTLPLITIGEHKESVFASTVQKDLVVKNYHLPLDADATTVKNLVDLITLVETELHRDLVIVNLLGMTRFAKDNFGITPSALNLLKQLETAGKKIILVVFGNAYSLKLLPKTASIILAYEDEPEAQKAAALVLVGKLKATGKLPVSLS